jgi:hypothetical protein
MSDFPARHAEPGTEISFTDSTGAPRVVKADAHGRVAVHDEEEAAQTSDLPLFKPAAPAKED